MSPSFPKVTHLAKLAQLPLRPDEKNKLTRQFVSTLKVVDSLTKLDTATTPPTYQVTGQTNVTRKDEIDTRRVLTQKQALANAKATHQGYFVVPAIFNHEA